MATFETSKQAVLDRINTLASSSSTTAEDSIYLAKALREAAADIAFVWRGPWTSTYTYVLGDVVQYDGNAYICINAHVAAATFDSASGSWQTMVVGGAQWFTGNTVPANSSGEDGDWFFNTADEKIHNRQSGTWVSIADLGGSIWTSSVGVGTGGEDGDFHFNETTQEISKRSSGTWTVLANLTPLNMSNVEVKTAYEANANTNEFSDAEQTKLAGIEAGSNLIINNNQIANGAGYITVGLPTGGTVGQVVTNTGAGAGGWADAAGGGGLELINEYLFTGSNSTLEVTLKAPVDNNYLCDVIFFSNLMPASNGDLMAKFLDASGSVVGQMTSGFEFKDINSSGNNYYYNTDGRLCNNLSGTDSNHGAQGQMWIYANSAQNTVRCPYLTYEFSFIASGGQKRHVEGSAMVNAALSTVRKFKLQSANGNGFQQSVHEVSNNSVLHYALRRT